MASKKLFMGVVGQRGSANFPMRFVFTCEMLERYPNVPIRLLLFLSLLLFAEAST